VDAEFAKAVTVATALLNQSTGVQRRSELRDIVSRLRQQKQIANNLSSAIAALAINRDIAERELQAEPEVAVLLLRQAVRHQDGAVLDNAVAILHSMNDAEVPALLVDRIRTCKDPTVGLALVTHLERLKDWIAPELAPACREAIQHAGLGDTPAGRAVLAGCAVLPGDRKE
jgi:Fe-S cluster assembly ATPase SufC